MFKKFILATTLAAFGAGVMAEARTTSSTVRDHTPRVKDRTPKVKLRGQRA